MADEMKNTNELVRRIMDEARAEAEKLRGEAERSVSDRRAALERRLREIEQTADERIAEARARLAASAEASIALVEGRAALRRESRIYRAAEERTREALRDLRGSEGYPSLLRDWIVEAALGLGGDRAIVSSPEADRQYVALAVQEAAAELDRRGVRVSLTVDTERAEPGQGVVLRDADGRRAFSNLVDDRIRRSGVDLRRIVYHSVVEGQHG